MKALLLIFCWVHLVGMDDASAIWPHRAKSYGSYFEQHIGNSSLSRQKAQAALWNALFAGRNDFLDQLDRSAIWPRYRYCEIEKLLPVENTVQEVLREAAAHRILAFNEQHGDAQQRYFLLANLQNFWDAGYRHLGYEAYFAKDTLLSGQLSGDFGFYFNDPVLAATARKAHEMGFHIFGYESEREVLAAYDWAEAINVREAGQADRVAEYANKPPADEKILLWAGGHHISKALDQNEDGRPIIWMAARLMRDHKLTVYSVDLTGCDAQGEVGSGAIGYKDSAGDWWVSEQFKRWGVDAQIRLTGPGEKSGPAAYRRFLGKEIQVPPKLRKLAESVFVQAFNYEQAETETAYDSILMRKDEHFPLYLPKGRFLLVAYSATGERLGALTIQVPDQSSSATKK